MKKIFITLGICAFLFAWDGNKNDKSSTSKSVNVETFAKETNENNIQIIDVRTPVEFSEAHIKNAINIDYFSKSFSETISKLDKQKTILVYCAAGGRSTSACSDFKKLGFKKVYNLIGGYDDWKE